MDIYAPNIKNDVFYNIIQYPESQPNLSRRIIIKSKMDHFININLLSNKQINEIANGLMLILFKHETDILNYYFEVDDNTINNYQLKKQKITGNKINKELVTIKNEISRLTDVINQYLTKPFENLASTHNEYNNNNKTLNMILIIINITLITLFLLNK